MSIDMENDMNGQKLNSAMNFDYDVEVVDEKDSVKTLRATYKRVVMKMNMPNASIDLDTDRPMKDSVLDLKKSPLTMMEHMFYAVVNKSFTMTVDPEGKVTSVTGMKEMGDAVVASMKVNENEKAIFEQSFNSQFNEETMKESFSQAFHLFPNKAIKVGDTWDNAMNFGGMMAGSMKTTYTVKDIKDNKVTLDVNSTMEMNNNKGVQTGTMVLDKNTGLVLEGNLQQQTEGVLKGTTKMQIKGREK